MKVIDTHIRVPEPVWKMLREQASRQHRSLNGQLVHLIVKESQQAHPTPERHSDEC